MLVANKFTLSLIVAFTFSRFSIVHAQAETDTDVDPDVTSTTATSTSAGATGTSNADPCLLQCAQQAATSAGCADVTDQDCICSSDTFLTEARDCLQSQCSPSVVAQAQAFESQACASASGDGASETEPTTSRNLASSGAHTQTSSVGSVLHSASSAGGSAAPSGASASASSDATADSEPAFDMNSIVRFAAVAISVVFGALVIG